MQKSINNFFVSKKRKEPSSPEDVSEEEDGPIPTKSTPNKKRRIISGNDQKNSLKERENGDSGEKATNKKANYDPDVEELISSLTDPGWRKLLADEFTKPYFRKLAQFIKKERESGKQVFPPHDEIFTAYNLCPPDKVEVLILGQDPYHGVGQGHGLAFSVKPGVTPPPSLRNMYKELATDIPGFKPPKHGYLTKWAKQGVFLLNTVLTVRKAEANSHQKQGWEEFTDATLKIVNAKLENVVFILWGAPAQKKEKLINLSKHHILKSPHPSPLSASRGFFGCKHFSKANQYLISKGKHSIDWILPQDPEKE